MGGGNHNDPASKVRHKDLVCLEKMGFRTEECIHALVYTGHDLQAATEYLLSHSSK
jgi:uncharacterized UBP type Zn finger protein